jgi:hypothetical protein
MANFKRLLLILTTALLGCSENDETEFFANIPEKERQQFAYQDIHQLSLTLSKLTKDIDETGFSPILKCAFHLEDNQHGPWPQAWVAFNISVLVSNVEITSIKRAGVLQGHSMDIQFQHELPKFGVKPENIKINIKPIAWMPSYPLIIINNETVAQ